MDEVLAKIGEIVKAASKGSFFFRGENEQFEHVSSGLFRKYRPNGTDTSAVEELQNKIVEEARRFTTENDSEEILSQLQHFESGLTNLIDFTTDYLIALYFACEGAPELDGRVVLLQREKPELFESGGPGNRVIAQKSVFVRPATGIVEPDEEISIPAHLKPIVLQYLRAYHGIGPQTIYNDLHGFIRHWSINQKASNAFMSGVAQALSGNHESAVAYFDESLFFLPRYVVYFERGCSFLELNEFKKAIDDFKRVQWSALDDGNPLLSGAAVNGLGVALYSLNRFVDAAKEFRSALTLYSMRYEPPHLFGEEEAYSNLVLAQMKATDFQAALLSAAEAMERGYDPGVRFRKIYGSIDSFESTKECIVPDSLARILMHLNQTDERAL